MLLRNCKIFLILQNWLVIRCICSLTPINKVTHMHTFHVCQIEWSSFLGDRFYQTLCFILTLHSIHQHNLFIFFILKQGYMFRLKVSHLQGLTTFSLPDALPTLGSHSVYNCGIHLVKTISKKVLFIKCVIYRLCLDIKILKILT